MMVFEATNMEELRAEIVQYLRLQMRSAMEQAKTTDKKQLKATANSRAFALGTAADSLESATFAKK